MTIKIEFKKAYATHKKGEVVERDSLLASRLIRMGVAKVFKPKSKSKKA